MIVGNEGYLWVAHQPGADMLFEWHTTREAKCLDKLIPPDFSGTSNVTAIAPTITSPGIARALAGQ